MNKRLLAGLSSIRKVCILLWPFVFIVLTLIGCFYLTKASLAASPEGWQHIDFSTVLSGMGTLALFIFSMFLAVAAFVGWSTVKDQIREQVEKVTNQRLEQAEREARGRSFAIQGYVLGETSVAPDLQNPSNEERLGEAISYSQTAYDFLKGTGLPVEFLALNNLLYYSCVLNEKTKARRGYLLGEAKRMRTAAEAHDAQNLLLTYARTILTFSLEPQEIADTCSLVADIVSDARTSLRLNEKQKREADYLASLCEQRAGGRSERSEP